MADSGHDIGCEVKKNIRHLYEVLTDSAEDAICEVLSDCRKAVACELLSDMGQDELCKLLTGNGQIVQSGTYRLRKGV
jgi:hypothetical protein